MKGKPRRLRLLVIASVIGLGGALGLAAAPASAATAQHASTPSATGSGQAARITAGTPIDAIVNYHSGLCLGITGGEDDAAAVQWTCNGHPDQQWSVGGTNSAGYYQLVNDDGECLGVAGGATAANSEVVGWSCLGTSHQDQYWYVDTSISCGGYYPIYNYKSGRVLGVSANSTAVGAAVVIYGFQDTCNNQFW